MSYKDNCKKENTPWIPPTPQEFTNAVEKALAQCRQKEGKTPTEPGTHNAGWRRITAAAAADGCHCFAGAFPKLPGFGESGAGKVL